MLNKYFININKLLRTIIVVLILVLSLQACKSTRHIPDDKFLLNKVEIKSDKNINIDEIKNYINPKLNRKVIGFFRFHLYTFNAVNRGKDRKWKKKIEEIVGEEPVLYDEYLIEKSTKQIKQHLINKGFFNAYVGDSTIYKTKKANVVFKIKLNNPFTVTSIKYYIEDYNLKPIIIEDSNNSLIKINRNYDADILEKERIRITNLLKIKGYYYFSKEYIYFEIDSNEQKKNVTINVGIKKAQRQIYDQTTIKQNHKKYKIRNIYVNTNYNLKDILQKNTKYFESLDTSFVKNIYFIKTENSKINFSVIAPLIDLEYKSVYNLDDVKSTIKHIQSLQLYKLVNIVFTEPKNIEDGFIDCEIQLTPFSKQSYTLEMEGTNSSGNFGAAGNLLYRNKSLFNGAEILELKLRSALEMQTIIDKNSESNNVVEYLPFNTKEYGGESKITLPRFFFPFVQKKFVKKYHPKTVVSALYNFQQRPDYTRVLTNWSFGYKWKSSKNISHFVNPVVISSVKLRSMSIDFLKSFSNPYIRESYTDHLISVSNYSFIYSNNVINKKKNFVYFRSNLESAGNILQIANKKLENELTNDYYTFFNNRYAQYVKSDFDFRYTNFINKHSNYAYRLFLGIGYPYGNLNALPFEKQYFSGGANSIRAWQVRTLGPGSYIDTLQVPIQASDIKIETNLEYRFNLFWIVEGAWFLDIGNIWSINKADDRLDSEFKFNKFYREFAVGSGVGARLDFSFFVFRLDLGVKLVEPQAPINKRIIMSNRKYNTSDFQLNFGIGYPF